MNCFFLTKNCAVSTLILNFILDVSSLFRKKRFYVVGEIWKNKVIGSTCMTTNCKEILMRGKIEHAQY